MGTVLSINEAGGRWERKSVALVRSHFKRNMIHAAGDKNWTLGNLDSGWVFEHGGEGKVVQEILQSLEEDVLAIDRKSAALGEIIVHVYQPRV